MSTGSKEPEDIVKDGVRQETPDRETPLPRGDGPAVTPAGTGTTEQQSSAGSGGADKAAGPAEEQDAEAGDDRGLTTDSSAD